VGTNGIFGTAEPLSDSLHR